MLKIEDLKQFGRQRVRLVRDAIVPMAAYAAVTNRIKIGSGVINNWTRNIGLLAATYLTLDDLAPGRIICGIGAWWDPLAKNVGIDRRKPLEAMRETVTGDETPLEHGTRNLPWRAYPCGWDRAGRSPWQTGTQECSNLHWCHRRQNDGNDW